MSNPSELEISEAFNQFKYSESRVRRLEGLLDDISNSSWVSYELQYALIHAMNNWLIITANKVDYGQGTYMTIIKFSKHAPDHLSDGISSILSVASWLEDIFYEDDIVMDDDQEFNDSDNDGDNKDDYNDVSICVGDKYQNRESIQELWKRKAKEVYKEAIIKIESIRSDAIKRLT